MDDSKTKPVNQDSSNPSPQQTVQASGNGTFLKKESDSLSNELPVVTNDYSSIYQPVYTTSNINQVQPVAPESQQQTPKQAQTQPTVQVQPAAVAAPLSEQTPAAPVQAPKAPAPIVKPITEPLVTESKEKIIYRERSGCSAFIGGFLWKIVSCIGCLLFIISFFIIGLAIWLNF
jgi:hypothetical protein